MVQTINKFGFFKRSTWHLLNANHLQWHNILINGHDRVNNHFGEEVLVGRNQLGAHGGCRTLFERCPSLSRWTVVHGVHCNFVDLAHGQLGGLSQSANNQQRMDRIFDVSFHRLNILDHEQSRLRNRSYRHEFACEQGDGGCTVADFGILRLCNINQRFRRWMNNIEKLEDSSSVVGNMSLKVIFKVPVTVKWK